MAIPLTKLQLRMGQLERWRKVMIDYLGIKFEQSDWHGIQDAASDLRDIDERIAGIKEQ